MNDIERIATREYEPSDNDVIRARLRTLGVQEYSFWVEQSAAPSYHFLILVLTNPFLPAGHEWLMYDVGGTRSSVNSHWHLVFSRCV